jgi:hypothetical protein
MAWIAYILALFAIAITPSNSKVQGIEATVERLQREKADEKCTMMVVVTPTGTATICAKQF